MCGIVGYLGEKDLPIILNGLKRLGIEDMIVLV